MTVVISSASDKEKIKNISTKDLEEILQAETEGIRGVSRLINGDLKFHTESLEVKKSLQEKSEWTRKIADSAAIKTWTYSVRVNGVKIEHIKTANQLQAIGYLQIANARLHPDVQIKKITWSTRAIREKKVFSTLKIEVATAETANRVIAEGLIIDYNIKDCESFTKGCTITQCFNCHKYSHIGRSYPNPTACGYCARAHPSTECNMGTIDRYRRGSACSKKGHEAWSTSCEIRIVEKRNGERAMQKRIPFYPIVAPVPGSRAKTSTRSLATQTAKRGKSYPPRYLPESPTNGNILG